MKGKQEWDKVYIDASLPSRTLKALVKIRFASKVVLFQVYIFFGFYEFVVSLSITVT